VHRTVGRTFSLRRSIMAVINRKNLVLRGVRVGFDVVTDMKRAGSNPAMATWAMSHSPRHCLAITAGQAILSRWPQYSPSDLPSHRDQQRSLWLKRGSAESAF